MTKTDIVNLVSEKVGLPTQESYEAVGRVIDAIKETLISGESIKISGFGSFKVRRKKARIGRNPKTRVNAEISARRVVTFVASDRLRSSVAKG